MRGGTEKFLSQPRKNVWLDFEAFSAPCDLGEKCCQFLDMSIP